MAWKPVDNTKNQTFQLSIIWERHQVCFSSFMLSEVALNIQGKVGKEVSKYSVWQIILKAESFPTS